MTRGTTLLFGFSIKMYRNTIRGPLYAGAGVGGKHIGMCAATVKQLRLGVHNTYYIIGSFNFDHQLLREM